MTKYEAIKILINDANREYMREQVRLHPEMYDPEVHEKLFTKEELADLSQSLRGAA